MKRRSFIKVFREFLAEFISSISCYLTVVAAFVGIAFGLENWKILIAVPFGCIFIGVVTAWICTLIQGKDQ